MTRLTVYVTKKFRRVAKISLQDSTEKVSFGHPMNTPRYSIALLAVIFAIAMLHTASAQRVRPGGSSSTITPPPPVVINPVSKG